MSAKPPELPEHLRDRLLAALPASDERLSQFQGFKGMDLSVFPEECRRGVTLIDALFVEYRSVKGRDAPTADRIRTQIETMMAYVGAVGDPVYAKRARKVEPIDFSTVSSVWVAERLGDEYASRF